MYLFLTGILIVLCSRTAHLDSINGAVEKSSKTYKNYKVFSVSGNRQSLIDLSNCLKEYEDIIIHRNRQYLEVMISPQVLEAYQEAVEARNLNSTLMIDDFSEILQKEKAIQVSARGLNWTAYHDIDVIYDWLKEMAKLHPDVAKLVVGGKSYEDRDILGLRIVTPNPNRKRKPVVFIASGVHAREWVAPATTTYFINELLTSEDPNIRALRDTLDWHIFPSVNPDGYHYSHTTDRMWRKTRSKVSDKCYGVDLNRNFDYKWGVYASSNDPCEHENYAGSKPFSEVETRTISEYIKSLGQILAYIDFHSNVPCLFIPFGDGEHAENYEDLVAIGESSLKYGQEASGLRPYAGPGTASDILYNVSGSSGDWVVSNLNAQLGFSYELRGHFFHWPPERIPEQGFEVTQMLRGLFVKAKELGYYC